MAKTTKSAKKENIKDTIKNELKAKLMADYNGIDGAEFDGFTKHTVIVPIEKDGIKYEVQVKLITPADKNGNCYTE